MALELSSVSLYPATQAQIQRQLERNFEHWNRGLSFERYMNRGKLVDIHEHAVDGKLTTWVLAPRDNPETLDFFCGCETSRRPAVIADYTSNQAKETVAYGISAVYCPPENRNKGYASHMMRLLHYVLAPPEFLPPFPAEWGTPPIRPANLLPGAFSALYSDVGSKFYELCGPSKTALGWMVKDHMQTVWQTKHLDIPSGQLRWLSIEDCTSLWDEDAAYMRHEVLQKSRDSQSVCCAFLPNAGVAAYQIRRIIFYLPGSPSTPVPEKWGVELEKVEDRSYAMWIASVATQPVSLVVCRIRATSKTFPLLLSAIMEAAIENKCDSIEIWNLDPTLSKVARDFNGVTVERTVNLPSLAWYGAGDDVDKVQFVFNERFSYC